MNPNSTGGAAGMANATTSSACGWKDRMQLINQLHQEHNSSEKASDELAALDDPEELMKYKRTQAILTLQGPKRDGTLHDKTAQVFKGLELKKVGMIHKPPGAQGEKQEKGAHLPGAQASQQAEKTRRTGAVQQSRRTASKKREQDKPIEIIIPLANDRVKTLSVHNDKSLAVEYAARYLEKLGVSPNPANLQLLSKHIPLEKCKVQQVFHPGLSKHEKKNYIIIKPNQKHPKANFSAYDPQYIPFEELGEGLLGSDQHHDNGAGQKEGGAHHHSGGEAVPSDPPGGGGAADGEEPNKRGARLREYDSYKDSYIFPFNMQGRHDAVAKRAALIHDQRGSRQGRRAQKGHALPGGCPDSSAKRKAKSRSGSAHSDPSSGSDEGSDGAYSDPSEEEMGSLRGMPPGKAERELTSQKLQLQDNLLHLLRRQVDGENLSESDTAALKAALEQRAADGDLDTLQFHPDLDAAGAVADGSAPHHSRAAAGGGPHGKPGQHSSPSAAGRDIRQKQHQTGRPPLPPQGGYRSPAPGVAARNDGKGGGGGGLRSTGAPRFKPGFERKQRAVGGGGGGGGGGGADGGAGEGHSAQNPQGYSQAVLKEVSTPPGVSEPQIRNFFYNFVEGFPFQSFWAQGGGGAAAAAAAATSSGSAGNAMEKFCQQQAGGAQGQRPTQRQRGAAGGRPAAGFSRKSPRTPSAQRGEGATWGDRERVGRGAAREGSPDDMPPQQRTSPGGDGGDATMHNGVPLSDYLLTGVSSKASMAERVDGLSRELQGDMFVDFELRFMNFVYWSLIAPTVPEVATKREAQNFDERFVDVYQRMLDILLRKRRRAHYTFDIPVTILGVRVVSEALLTLCFPLFCETETGKAVLHETNALVSHLLDPVGYLTHISTIESSPQSLKVMHKKRLPPRMSLSFTSPVVRFIVGEAQSREAKALLSGVGRNAEGADRPGGEDTPVVFSLLTPAVASRLLSVVANHRKALRALEVMSTRHRSRLSMERARQPMIST